MQGRFDVKVYRSAGGRSPVLDWLADRTDEQQELCEALIEALTEEGPALGWPDAKPLGKGLYELRGHVGTVQLRLLYFFKAGAIAVVAAGFVKKGPQMLDQARKLAERRRTEVERDPATHTLSITTEELLKLRRRRR
ncbi:MAG: type II toxin-antitoxin system RelE/ParE family toxin [bacterium]